MLEGVPCGWLAGLYVPRAELSNALFFGTPMDRSSLDIYQKNLSRTNRIFYQAYNLYEKIDCKEKTNIMIHQEVIKSVQSKK